MTAMDDPERIYLQPVCCAEYSHYGRLWNEHPVELGCDDGAQPTEYVRADISQSAITALQAQLAERDDTIRRLMNDLQAHKDALAQVTKEQTDG